MKPANTNATRFAAGDRVRVTFEFNGNTVAYYRVDRAEGMGKSQMLWLRGENFPTQVLVMGADRKELELYEARTNPTLRNVLASPKAPAAGRAGIL